MNMVYIKQLDTLSPIYIYTLLVSMHKCQNFVLLKICCIWPSLLSNLNELNCVDYHNLFSFLSTIIKIYFFQYLKINFYGQRTYKYCSLNMFAACSYSCIDNVDIFKFAIRKGLNVLMKLIFQYLCLFFSFLYFENVDVIVVTICKLDFCS